CRHAVMTDNTAQWSDSERANCQKLTYRAGINYDDFAPMVYTVPASQQRLIVLLDQGDPALRAAFVAGVPIPPDAQAAAGTDGQASMPDTPAQSPASERPNCQRLTYRAAINYAGSAPMVHTGPASQQRLIVLLDQGDPALRAAFVAGVPIPPDAHAAAGTDGQ